MGPSKIKDKVRRSARAREVLRRTGRLRWRAKYLQAQSYGAVGRERPWRWLRFVFFDPEFDNFTYELANEPELLDFLAKMLDIERSRVAEYLAETRTDPGLTTELWRRLRWRFDYKHRPPLGRRATCYLLTRILQPQLVVETGVQDGLGSLAVLRALAHNADEGRPGRLVSVDTLPTAGWLVPDCEREAWQLLIGSSDQVLPGALGTERLGLFLQDTGADLELARRELEIALGNATEDAVFISQTQRPALAAICDERGMSYGEFWHRPRDHVFSGTITGFGHGGERAWSM